MPLVLLLTLGGLLLIAAFFLRLSGYSLGSAPPLPSWARVDGKELESSPYCGRRDGPPCRQITFGTNATLTDVRTALLPEFEQRGWRIEEHGDIAFSAHSPENGVCIVYVADYRADAIESAERFGGSSGVQLVYDRWAGYSTRIDAVVDDCTYDG
jgi:hypothetical protein